MACCRVKSGLTGHRLCGALGLVGFAVCSSRRFQASGFSGLSEDKGARHSILSGYSRLKPRPRDMLLQISTPAKNWRGRRPYLIYGTHPDQGSWQQAKNPAQCIARELALPRHTSKSDAKVTDRKFSVFNTAEHREGEVLQ